MTFLLFKGNVLCRLKGLFDFVICNARKNKSETEVDLNKNLELESFFGK